MKNILLFAGTSEGRILAEYLSELDVNLYVSTATEYGIESVKAKPSVHTMAGRMEQNQMQLFIVEHRITLVIDATHPYAQKVTENIQAACQCCAIEYIRCLRESSHQLLKEEDDYVVVDSVKAAADYLKTRHGNILIATGSKELRHYTDIPDYKERCYARVLSTKEAVEESVELGFSGAHLIAMQGPFSEALNSALLQHTRASYFVTKESGNAGGFKEKLAAAKAIGVTLVIVGRPNETGSNIEQVKEYVRKTLKNCNL